MSGHFIKTFKVLQTENIYITINFPAMKILLLLLLSFACGSLYAQYQVSPELRVIPKQKKLPKLKLNLGDQYRLQYQFNQQLPNDIPNAINQQQVAYLKPIFRNNNGNGFDVYESPLDSMPVVKPDATFSSNMPTGNYQLLQKPLKKKGEGEK